MQGGVAINVGDDDDGDGVLSPAEVTGTQFVCHGISGGGDGLNCWDTKGEGIQDPMEDTNGDGAWNAAACGPVTRIYEEDTTLSVSSGECTDLIDTIRGLDSWSIAADATVTIDVSGGPYACAESLVFSHPDGARIKVIGNTNGRTTIAFESVNGLVIASRHALGGFDGFLLSGTGDAGEHGVVVGAHASASVGPDPI